MDCRSTPIIQYKTRFVNGFCLLGEHFESVVDYTNVKLKVVVYLAVDLNICGLVKESLHVLNVCEFGLLDVQYLTCGKVYERIGLVVPLHAVYKHVIQLAVGNICMGSDNYATAEAFAVGNGENKGLPFCLYAVGNGCLMRIFVAENADEGGNGIFEFAL